MLFYLQLLYIEQNTQWSSKQRTSYSRSESISQDAGVETVSNQKCCWVCPIKKKKKLCRYSSLIPPGTERSHVSPSNIVLNHLERKEIKVFSFTESVWCNKDWICKTFIPLNSKLFLLDDTDLQKCPSKHAISAFEWGVVTPPHRYLYRCVTSMSHSEETQPQFTSCTNVHL